MMVSKKASCRRHYTAYELNLDGSLKDTYAIGDKVKKKHINDKGRPCNSIRGAWDMVKDVFYTYSTVIVNQNDIIVRIHGFKRKSGMSDKDNPTYKEMVAFLEDYRKDRLASTKTGFDLQANNFNYNRAGEQLDSLKLTKGMMEPNHSIWDK